MSSMSTRIFAPLQDCTHNINQKLNIRSEKPHESNPVISVRQNNPYSSKVVPNEEEEAAMILQAQALNYEQYALMTMMMQLYNPSLSSMVSMSHHTASTPQSPLTPAVPTTSHTSSFPVSQSLTKVYREGRPVPTFKSPSKPVIMMKGNYIVTVAFRHKEAQFFLERAEAFYSTEDEAGGSFVVVDGDRGIDLGRVVSLRSADGIDSESLPEAEIQRVATNDEIERYHSLAEDEAKATSVTISQCNKLGLQKLQVLDTTFQFDKQKLTIRYKANERIYFVPLLKALNSLYKCRIWMEKVE